MYSMPQELGRIYTPFGDLSTGVNSFSVPSARRPWQAVSKCNEGYHHWKRDREMRTAEGDSVLPGGKMPEFFDDSVYAVDVRARGPHGGSADILRNSGGGELRPLLVGCQGVSRVRIISSGAYEIVHTPSARSLECETECTSCIGAVYTCVKRSPAKA